MGWVTSATSLSKELADSSNTVQDSGSQPVSACDLHFVTCVNEGACAGYVALVWTWEWVFIDMFNQKDIYKGLKVFVLHKEIAKKTKQNI